MARLNPTTRLIATAALIAAGSSIAAGAQTTATTNTNTTATAATAPAAPAVTPPNPTVGGAEMLVTKKITENAAAAPNLTTLVTAVTTAGLIDTLSGPGPFTVFAPTNDAFGRLAPGTVDTLLKPENKPTLTKVLTYHVVPGTITLEDIRAKIEAEGGKATYTTVEGEPLVIEINNGAISITDVGGGKAYIQTPDVRQANGVVHVINGVLIPKLG